MILTFLGTGTSTGIPVLGCHCPTCLSQDPRDRRLRTSALLTTDTGRHVMIDCGPDMRQQLLQHHNGSIDGVVITHSHYDHTGGVDDLRTLSYTSGIDIYCREDVADDLRRVLPYCFNNSGYPNVAWLRLNNIREMEPFQVAGIEFTPLPVMHGKLPILGFKTDNLAYITDATVIPPETTDAIKGIDTLVINALRHTPNPTHQNLEQALAIVRKVAPRRTYLIHMSHQMGLHAEESPKLPDSVQFAYDGLEIEIPDPLTPTCKDNA